MESGQHLHPLSLDDAAWSIVKQLFRNNTKNEPHDLCLLSKSLKNGKFYSASKDVCSNFNLSSEISFHHVDSEDFVLKEKI